MTLTYPWFLLGLLTIVIPIVIHFFELRKPQLIQFTNVGFIREVRLVTARQKRLKHLLVLITRITFLVFLIFMFCQPIIPASKQGMSAEDVVSVLVDTSPSMQAHAANEQSLLDRAVETAKELAVIYPAPTRFRLSEVPHILTKSAFKVATEQLTIVSQTGSMRSALDRLQSGFHMRGEQTFILSDFQKNDFSLRLLNQIDSTKQVFLVPIASKNIQNIYIDSVTLQDAFIRRGTDITLRIRLRNAGNEAVANCQVKLFIGDKQVAVYNTGIGAENTVTTVVPVRLEANELQLCRVEIKDFPVIFDNTYYFTLQPSPQIRIIDLATDEPATQRLYANESLFSYTKSNQQSISYTQLEAANLALVQQPQIDASLRENLKRLIERGGSVVIVPPSAVASRSSYTQLFQELGIASVRWELPSRSTPNLREIATPSAQNPFFREVFAAQTRQTVMPKVAPVLRWSRSGADILRLQDGDGYLASFNSGRGTVYLFSAPFEEAYSDFTSHALFVPVMYRLAMQSFRNDQQPSYRLNQRTVVLDVPELIGNTEQVFKLTKDSLTLIPTQRLQAGKLRFDVPQGMQSPGFYQLTRDGRTIKTLAFNFDKRESELAHYSAAELRGLIGDTYPNVQVYDASNGQSVAAQYQAERVATPLWQYCLWAALACLLVEVLLLRFMTSRKMAEPIAVTA